MTRKDYQRIADAINLMIDPIGSLSSEPNATVVAVALSLATTIRDDNPRFDCDRFLKACGARR